MELSNKVAIVTGGGRHIGQSIAYRLSELGCKIVVCARTQKEIDHTAAVIQEQGGQSIAVNCDVGEERDVARVVEACLKFFGRIDFLVNNAGNYTRKPLVDTTLEEFNDAVNANLRGAFLFSRAVIPELKKAPSGRIVNIASLFGTMPGSHVSIYSAVKAGLIGFSKALARELHADGINVNAVCPGAVRWDEEQVIELEETRHVLGHHVLPRDVADTVAFLLQNQSAQITGAAIEIPGATGIKVAEISKS
jgi:3-oxoacyl-[acyl-carrier protein] reductase